MPVAVRYPIEFPKAITRQNSTHYYIKHFWPGQIMTSLRSCEHSHVLTPHKSNNLWEESLIPLCSMHMGAGGFSVLKQRAGVETTARSE